MAGSDPQAHKRQRVEVDSHGLVDRCAVERCDPAEDVNGDVRPAGHQLTVAYCDHGRGEPGQTAADHEHSRRGHGGDRGIDHNECDVREQCEPSYCKPGPEGRGEPFSVFDLVGLAHGSSMPGSTHALVRGASICFVSTAQKNLEVLIRMLDPELPLPHYAHAGDAGADLVARHDVELAPQARVTVPTGVSIALPDGYAAFIHPRSGLAARHGVTIVNAPGTVDAGYRGEIAVTLLNTDSEVPVALKRGDRIAQLVIQSVVRARFIEAEHLPGSDRGSGGFGSSGGWADGGHGR